MKTMNSAPFWASITLGALGVLAETPNPVVSAHDAASSCTASLVTTICDYTKPGPEFAVAAGGRSDCWEYCNDHTPCNFVIFAAGNPYTGTGTCWLYPGTSFDASKGSSDCANPWLSVYSKPVCAGEAATPTAGACAATATPSAIASVCGYPTPPNNCWDTCSASSSASDCISQCAKADSCTYAIFNPHNPSNTPYSSGSCWMYPSGKFDAGSAKTCTGAPEQYVYENVCPKPSKSSSSVSPSATKGPTGSGGTGTAGATPTSTSGAAAGSNGGGTSGDTPGSTDGAVTGSNDDGTASDAAGSSDVAGSTDGTAAASSNSGKTTKNTGGSTTTSENSASTGLSLTTPLTIGAAVLIWQAFQ
ncbi:hypothetical protein V495_00438 [Pseudogymnoascus sp. VKM F-4514 (FW-929)]|nr:hypothetical protein V495_00438 [Pseudogymnoascus sp. VKM F-4514 (FW-929)]KFY62903.1 hypothetical protein V497_02161 [Pseudogymnoascus sp. VKM F-4516 (FW-969)]